MNAQHGDRSDDTRPAENSEPEHVEKLDELPADPGIGESPRTDHEDPQTPTRPDRWLWIPAG